jgi:hypothetical protein
MPAWLTIAAIPCIYLLVLFMGYETTFGVMEVLNDHQRPRVRNRLAVMIGLHGRIRDISRLRGQRARQAATARSFRAALQQVRRFKQAERDHERAMAEKAARLTRFAGVDGVDERGRRLDQRAAGDGHTPVRQPVSSSGQWRI